jgi:hypothetical protein
MAKDNPVAPTLQVSHEMLQLIAEIVEFKGRWESLKSRRIILRVAEFLCSSAGAMWVSRLSGVFSARVPGDPKLQATRVGRLHDSGR